VGILLSAGAAAGCIADSDEKSGSAKRPAPAVNPAAFRNCLRVKAMYILLKNK
jgi:hypothetical protein